MNAYPDKQETWLQNLVSDPFVLHVKTSLKVGNIFSLGEKKPKTLKVFLTYEIGRKGIWLNKNSLAQILVVALLLSSWSEYEGKYLKYIKARCQV